MKVSRLLLDALETFPNFVIIDKNANVVYLNESYAVLLGIQRDAAIGKPVQSVIPGTRLHLVLKSQKKEVGELMTLFDHTVNDYITVVCNRMPIFRDGQLVGAAAVTTMQNITETISRLHSEIQDIKKENAQYKKELDILMKTQHSLDRIIGTSHQITEIKSTIEDFAFSNLSILITGETGVGKELFARAIHDLSPRKLNNYVKINCAAIPNELLESELFGYESGAFSGALKGGKIGKFELANNGTLLLDEIGEMPMTLQSKLLRVLHEQELEHVGGVKPIKINVRIICSTNQNLQKLIAEGKFRRDLYYRINTVELNIPPLRERIQDIPELCQYFLERYNMQEYKNVKGISREVLELFSQYSWPGNIRELEHVMERLFIISDNKTITLKNCDFLKKRMMIPESHTLKINSTDRCETLAHAVDDTEKERILSALEKTGGNKAKAARILDIDRTSLYYKMKKLGIYK